MSADRDSDSSLSECEGEPADSDAETERLHISPQKKRSGMMVQHTGSSSIVTSNPISFEVAVARDDLRRPISAQESAEERAGGSAPATPTRSLSKKRKREENSSTPRPNHGSPDAKAIQSAHPPKKKVQALATDAIESDKKKKEAVAATVNGEAKSPKKASAANGIERIESDNGDASVGTDPGRDDDGDAENQDETPPAPAEEETGDCPDVSREEDEGLSSNFMTRAAADFAI